MPFNLQSMSAQNGDQLKGQRQVIPRWPLRALLVRNIRMQMAQVTTILPQHYCRWFYPHYLCSLWLVREKANTTAIWRHSRQVIVLPQTLVSA